MTWTSDEPPPTPSIPYHAWPRVLLRGSALFTLILVGLSLKFVLRLVERPIWGLRRPLSPYVTQAVCRLALPVLGVRLTVSGHVMRARGALVANHASWLDIFVLNAAARVYFVSKAEVAGWPGIGALARATGTVFIRRNRRDAAQQKLIFEGRLRAGHKLLFFPEGTSSDGLRVLPFKSTLFEAFFAENLRDFMQIQPVSVTYFAPEGRDPRFYGWWGDMEFARHLLAVLGQSGKGAVNLVFHPPLRVAEMDTRKTLANAAENSVRAGFSLNPKWNS
ncbi:MAG: lyso-ornithine lipid O-acyltransferase [Roseinatronobacter sp.]